MNRSLPHLAIAGLLSAFAATLVFLTWRDPPPGPAIPGAVVSIADAVRRQEPLSPIPHGADDVDPARAALGAQLFGERLLSRDSSMSCASCHPLNRAGVDGLPRSSGVGAAPGIINTPTVFNSRYNFVQFWDGRVASLEQQVAGPLHSPIEMASSWDEAIARLSAHEGYRAAFAELYREGITPATIADAIASFERTLVTPDSRFDLYLRGDPSAVTAEELEGYARFKNLGCASCHQGINVGGNLFQRFGLVGDYFADRGGTVPADLGRFNVTGREADRHVFKVPGLRNVALTAPYFHDGSVDTLDEAVAVMGRYQLGRALNDEDRRLIVAFLHTLTGTYRGEILQ